MDSPFIAMIMIWAPDFAPQNWAFCAGQQLPINQNQALFSLLANRYGGNGTTTFGLPDLRGRVPLGVGAMPGGMNHQLGQSGGLETTTLTVTELPPHTHSGASLHAQMQAWDTPGTDHNPAAGKGLAAGKAGDGFQTQPVRAYAEPSGNPVNLAGGAIVGATAPTGGGMPFNNMQPYIALNFCIALFGIYPPRQ